MFISFIGVNEKFINLNAIALIEDQSDSDRSVAVLTTTDGIEIQLTGEDADVLFARAEELIGATEKFVVQLGGGVKQ